MLQVNGQEVDELSHDDVVSIIRSTKDTVPGGELILLIRPNGQSHSPAALTREPRLPLFSPLASS